MLDIALQPKQQQILNMMRSGRAVVIGAGGGRGAAKSGGADRIELILMGLDPGHVDCIVMRNYDQVRKYHIEPMMRQWPELEKYFNKSESRLVLPAADGKVSQLDFSYAESLADVERRFRSANYRRIIVDQAEQFTEPELREMRNANRSPGHGKSRMLLLHNMGGVGIQTLRKWFYTKEYNETEDPNDYDFIKVNPWDNVEWVREALREDGLTPKDYYSWTDAERKEYAATRGQYTRGLASQDPTLAARDWDGDWNVLEGAYFGQSYDRAATSITAAQVRLLIKPWDMRWMSQDWGKSHFCSTHWHAVTKMAPSEIQQVLGWESDQPLKVVITYRRSIVSEMTAVEVAQRIREVTPVEERAKIRRFFLSPDAFGDRDSGHTIAERQGKELRAFELPPPEVADNERIGGWQLMSDLLANTKAAAQGKPFNDTVWLISNECPELAEAISLAMRDPKNLDDVLKTDKGQARLEQDVLDDVRYGIKSFLNGAAKPFSYILQEKVAQVAKDYGPTAANITRMKMEADRKKEKRWKPQYL